MTSRSLLSAKIPRPPGRGFRLERPSLSARVFDARRCALPSVTAPRGNPYRGGSVGRRSRPNGVSSHREDPVKPKSLPSEPGFGFPSGSTPLASPVPFALRAPVGSAVGLRLRSQARSAPSARYRSRTDGLAALRAQEKRRPQGWPVGRVALEAPLRSPRRIGCYPIHPTSMASKKPGSTWLTGLSTLFRA